MHEENRAVAEKAVAQRDDAGVVDALPGAQNHRLPSIAPRNAHHHLVVRPHALHAAQRVADPVVHVHHLVERREEAEGARHHLLLRVVEHAHRAVARRNLLVPGIVRGFLSHDLARLAVKKRGNANFPLKLTRHFERDEDGGERLLGPNLS